MTEQELTTWAEWCAVFGFSTEKAAGQAYLAEREKNRLLLAERDALKAQVEKLVSVVTNREELWHYREDAQLHHVGFIPSCPLCREDVQRLARLSHD